MTFYRVQETGITLEKMKCYDSLDGGDGYSVGLCVSDTPDNFGGAWGAYDDTNGEVVVLKGRVLAKIYDGYRIRPTQEIARFTVGEWQAKIDDETAWDYE